MVDSVAYGSRGGAPGPDVRKDELMQARPLLFSPYCMYLNGIPDVQYSVCSGLPARVMIAFFELAEILAGAISIQAQSRSASRHSWGPRLASMLPQ